MTEAQKDQLDVEEEAPQQEPTHARAGSQSGTMGAL